MTAAPRVSILIPASRHPERLRDGLASLAADGCRVEREILVLLNGATPEVRAVANATSGITILESEVNLGVAGGYNRLRTAARGELLALTHDDVEMLPGWLDPLVETLDQRPEAGLVGGLVLWPDGRLRADGWILWRDPITTPRWREPLPAPEAICEIEAVDYVAGSFGVVRAAIFDRIGGLDESLYPAYWVDVTLALAVRAQGQIVLVDPRARQVHHEGTLQSGYKHFVSRRNLARVKAVWAAELERDHVPYADSEAAWAAARRRTREVALRIVGERRWERCGQPWAFTVEAPVQERRALRAEAEVRAGWAAQCEAELAASREAREAERAARGREVEAAVQAERVARGRELEAAQQAVRAAEAELAGLRALASTRWVRLYSRAMQRLARLEGRSAVSD